MWAIHTNIISDKRWNAAAPSTRLAFLNNLDQSLVPVSKADLNYIGTMADQYLG